MKMPLKLQFENVQHSTLRLTWKEHGLDYRFQQLGNEDEADLVLRAVNWLLERDWHLGGEDLTPVPFGE